MADTVARIKELDKQRASLIETAKTAALSAANTAIAALNELGFNYRLIGDGGKATGSKRKSKSKSRKGTRTIKDAPCSICKFQTSPPHDARKHRFSQGKKKRPFTAQELAKMGLKKI